MSRRKQAKPRALKHDGTDELDDLKSPAESNADEDKENLSHADGDEMVLEDENYQSDGTINDDESIDSYFTDLYSSNTSASYSPSISDIDSIQHSQTAYMNHTNKVKNEDELPKQLDVSRPSELKTNAQIYAKSIHKLKRHDGNNCNGGNYTCQFCDKVFPRLGYLKKHEQSHIDHMPFKCDYCQRLFKHKRSRDRHTKLHTGDRRYKCLHCEAAFSRSDHLKIHMKTHDNQKPFQCTVCNRGYNTAAALTSHMQNHKKQIALTGSPTLTYSSRYSPRSTGSASSVTSINAKRRPESAGNAIKSPIHFMNFPRCNPLTCLYCTKSDFSSLDQLHSHIQNMHGGLLKTHATSSSNFHVTCEFCKIKFPSIQLLVNHIRATHTDKINNPKTSTNDISSPLQSSPRLRAQNGQDEFSNPVKEESKCLAASTIKEEVDDCEHEQNAPTDLSQPKTKKTKTEEENTALNDTSGTFLCNQCTAAFPDFESFRTHLKSHLQQESANLICQTCGTVIEDQNDYEVHIASHFFSTLSEYSCTAQCRKTFSSSEDLQKHLFETHSQSLYKCVLCSEIFDAVVAIQMHFAVAHTNELKIYRCTACSDTFVQEKDFRLHIRTRHLNQGNIQCVFCRFVCNSELEMHFHLSSHAKQYKCPSCPESFHIEFLLDRHLQTHHSQKESGGTSKQKSPINNNTLEYQHRYPSTLLNKSAYFTGNSKFYQPLQIETVVGKQQSHFFQGLYDSITQSQRFLDAQQSYLSPNKINLIPFQGFSPVEKFPSASKNGVFSPSITRYLAGHPDLPNIYDGNIRENKMYSCGICERKDFSTEAEANTHRKIAHNIKTGVSLRCAYCNGDFKSRSELENHMKVAHNTTGKHKCLICDEIFPSPAVLAEHKLTHCKVGNSGRCSHCSIAINDVTAFKVHLNEHSGQEIPIQCICCRQTLHSEFEISLHARFHTKTTENCEKTCALCLQTIPPGIEQKICEACFKKHKFSSKNILQPSSERQIEPQLDCNLCKKLFSAECKLKEHLVEHTFAGCEDHGYNCYICSSVFTSPSGLISHIQEHGNNSKPYDCNRCNQKFFFRAELENHSFIHNVVKYSISINANEQQPNSPPDQASVVIKNEKCDIVEHEDDEEYIEIEDKNELEKSNETDEKIG